MWGIDDVLEDSKVEAKALLDIRTDYSKVKFVRGFLGNNNTELPENYFDLVYSISVIEHVPDDKLKSLFDESVRILKSGCIVSHTYDIYYRQNTENVFNAFENSGLQWLKPKSTMNVFWEDWLGKFDKDYVEEILGKIVFENPMEVAEKYMWQKERSVRPTPLNWMTVLSAGIKPK